MTVGCFVRITAIVWAFIIKTQEVSEPTKLSLMTIFALRCRHPSYVRLMAHDLCYGQSLFPYTCKVYRSDQLHNKKANGQSSWLQVRRPGFDSRHYQKKK
jgi:hypothetical protein